MKPIQTVSLVGLGAIGSAYLSKISETLPMEQIRVIASGRRAEYYRNNGVRINGKTYFFPLSEPREQVEPADLLIFAVKFGQLEQAIQDAKSHVGQNTVVLSLLNGITSEEIIGKAYGAEKVLFSLAVAIDAVRDGRGTTYQNLGRIPFGEAKNPPGAWSEPVRRVQEFFQRTGIAHEVPQDMLHTLWWKFMINVGINQVTAVLRAPYGVMQHPGRPRELMIEAFQEVVELSRVAGVSLSGEDIEECLRVIKTMNPVGKTSMLQDVEAGRETEVDIFSGTVLRMGERYGMEFPVNRMLNRLLLAYEDMVLLKAGGTV